ncbi:aminodeoxychorismate lyase [Lysinibacillus sp. KU-BSD001]|uniref:aminodeoxychorismate lyase n=1 Tax=Lysinibacillus sp. KU-BSD001 TaxID=3141328 RepID=UPI0036E51B03
MLCWMNGHYIDANELCISPFDHGFLYGLGFFETFRTYDGKVPFLEEHMARLNEALHHFHINLPYTMADFQQVIEQLNEAAQGDGYFRLNVSAGVHDIGLQPTIYSAPTVIVFRKPLMERPRGKEKEAVWLKTPRNTAESGLRFKSHHYGNNVLARFEVPNLADYEGIFQTADGFVAEGITSNIFWVKDDILYTPALETGILGGITRKQVLHFARKLGLIVKEGKYQPVELEQADECFVTNAVQELVPIHKIGESYFTGTKGQVYQQLHEAYIDEILQRIKGD